MEPPPPPQRQRLDTDGSFEPTGVSEVPSELELRLNKEENPPVQIEYLHANEFARNFNTPLIDLNGPMIVQVLPFSSPISCVSLSLDMSSTR